MKKLKLTLVLIAVVVATTSTALSAELISPEVHTRALAATSNPMPAGDSINWWVMDLISDILDRLAELGR